MTKIIAELGINWSGDINIAKDMILQSKRAGADFVKFQMFNEEVIKDSKYRDELSEMILDFEKINILREYAYQQHIGFGVSTMYPEAFDIIRKLKNPIDFVKIRFTDRNNHELAQRAVDYCRDTDNTLIVSVEDFFMGSKLRYDTSIIYERYSFTNYMYCISKYPPELSEICSNYISSFYFSGYSNHFPSPYLPMIAVARGLKYVEIHVKKGLRIYRPGFDCCTNPMLNENQIDENISIDFNNLKEVCDFRDTLLKLRTR